MSRGPRSLCAAWRNPVQAVRASAPPTLILRTPIRASSLTVVKSAPTSTLTGFGCDGADDRGDVARRSNSGGIQAVSARLGVGRQPANGLDQIRPSDDEAFRTCSQEHTGSSFVDGAARGSDPLHGKGELEERGQGSPVESSIESPATPVAVAAETFTATAAGSIANPPSKSAFTGTSTPWAIAPI